MYEKDSRLPGSHLVCIVLANANDIDPKKGVEQDCNAEFGRAGLND